MFSPGEQADASFQLLASSTAHRYIRVAREFAVSSPVFAKTASSHDARDALLHKATEWAEIVMNQKEREVEEVSLALAIPILAEHMPGKSLSLFVQLAICENPAAMWVKTLAIDELARLNPVC